VYCRSLDAYGHSLDRVAFQCLWASGAGLDGPDDLPTDAAAAVVWYYRPMTGAFGVADARYRGIRGWNPDAVASTCAEAYQPGYRYILGR